MGLAKFLSCFGLALVLASFGGGCPARAADKEPKVVYKGEVIGPAGKAEEKEFNLSKKQDLRELTTLLEQGAVVELAKEQEVNPLAITWDLGLWTLVVFGLLCFFLNKIAWQPMLDGLKNREERIRSAVEDAKTAREEAQRLRDQYQREMDKAQEKVGEIHEEARKNAQRTAEEIVAKAKADSQAERSRALREIETAKDQALQQIWSQSANLATVVASKAIRRQITLDDQRRLVDEALADMGTSWK